MREVLRPWKRSRGRVVVSACAVLWLGVPVSAQEGRTNREGDTGRARECLPAVNPGFGCGVGRTIDSMWPELDTNRYARELQERLRADPEEDDDVWRRLADFLAEEEDATALEEAYKRAHWQPSPKGEWDRDGWGRLEWLDAWRRAKPDSRQAWLAWMDHEIEERGAASVEGELLWALETTPDAEGARVALSALRRRQQAGEENFELWRFFEEPSSPGFDVSLLPQPFRDRWPAAAPDGLSQHALLRDLAAAHPDVVESDPDLQLAILAARVQDRGYDDDEEAGKLLASFQAFTRRELPILLHFRACRQMQYLPQSAERMQACQEDVYRRAETAGLHLRTATYPGRPDHADDRWAWLEFWIYYPNDRIEHAVRSYDARALRTLLLDGPDLGTAERWRWTLQQIQEDLDLIEAVEGQTESLEEREVLEYAAALDPIRLRDLKRTACELLTRVARSGDLDDSVVGASTECPERLGAMAEALSLCGLDEPLEALHSGLEQRLPDMSLAVLKKLDAPVQALLDEVDRRLEEENLAKLEARSWYQWGVELRLFHGHEHAAVEQIRDWAALDPFGLRDWVRQRSSIPPYATAAAAEGLLAGAPRSIGLHLRLAFEALFPAAGDADPEKARHHLKRVRQLKPTVRQSAEARYLTGRLLITEGRAEEATDHFADFFDRLIEHGACHGRFASCDRDYLLHLLAVGDEERLRDYWRRREASVERGRRVLDELGLSTFRDAPKLLHASGVYVMHDDAWFRDQLIETGCGLPSAEAHLRALLESSELERSEAASLRGRLAFEQTRSCRRTETPKPWVGNDKDPYGRAMAASMLTADDVPSRFEG